VIRVYDAAGNVIETHQHAGEFKRVMTSRNQASVNIRNPIMNSSYGQSTIREVKLESVGSDYRPGGIRGGSGSGRPSALAVSQAL
jgi:hypothetical protein